MKTIKQIWGRIDRPAAVFSKQGELIYENEAAVRLSSGPVLSGMEAQEAAALTEACRSGRAEGEPLFCRIGKEVYSAVLLPWEEYIVCVFHLVTAYYQSSQRALDEAIMASKAKTNFLSEMSHDIRTPMGAIIGLTEIALSQKDTPVKLRECLEKIKVASGHMMSLLNEVLDMSRIESGKVQIQPRDSNIADLLHEILIVAKPQAAAGKLQFHLELGEVAWEHIQVDGVRFKQICLNLLSNAIKYTPAGGKVSLFFAIEREERDGWVRATLRVTDNGIGMSREFLSKIFSPFEREEKSTVSKIQGTGLGMAITKNLVELMEGTIQVESETDKGSCFTVEIPFRMGKEEDGFVQELEGKRVLLLYGEEKQGSAVRKMLESLHIAVDWARDAGAAVSQINDAELSNTEYLAFLLPEKVPGVDLMLFLPELRRRMGSSLPVLMLSEGDWSQVEYVLTQAGVDSFLPMPLFRSRLAAGLYACTKAGKEREARAGGENRRDFSHKRLLLVEDNELNREIAQELLGETGIEIETAENGRQAVERFSASSPFYYDIIFMDIQMPVLNGLDATREIRKLDREDAKTVPVIAMTANAFVEDVQNSLEAGMNAHISKPLDMERVFATMEQLLGGARE